MINKVVVYNCAVETVLHIVFGLIADPLPRVTREKKEKMMLSFLQRRLSAMQVMTAVVYIAMTILVVLVVVAAVLPANVSGYVIRELVICILASALVGLAALPMAIIETWRQCHAKEEQYSELDDPFEQLPDRFHHHSDRGLLP